MIPFKVWLFWTATGVCLFLLALVVVGTRSLSWVFGPSRNPH